jgi:hypothetical protein
MEAGVCNGEPLKVALEALLLGLYDSTLLFARERCANIAFIIVQEAESGQTANIQPKTGKGPSV